MNATAQHALLRPCPASGPDDADAWRVALMVAASELLPPHLELTLLYDQEEVRFQLELRPFQFRYPAASERVYYRQSNLVTLPGPGDAADRTLGPGSLGLLGTAVGGSLGGSTPFLEAVADAKRRDPSLRRTLAVLELRHRALDHSGPGGAPARAAGVLAQQLVLVPLLCARDDEHRRVLDSLVPAWPGTVAELLTAADGILQP